MCASARFYQGEMTHTFVYCIYMMKLCERYGYRASKKRMTEVLSPDRFYPHSLML